MSKAVTCWMLAGLSLAMVAGSAAIAHDEVVVIKKATPTTVVTIERPAAIAPEPPFVGERAAVDVALLLDTSNSMDGLIDQAKRQLWSIVNEFAAAEKAGQTPLLRVALFEYGNNDLPAAEGYIRQVVPLTDDLDALSEALFALTTNGGDEYCGQVIDEAITRLDWSPEPGGYKAIFIAGNEPFTQGTVNYKKVCKRAIEYGVIVNTIHCGDYQAGVDGSWRHGAKLAEGEYLNIDQDRAVVHIDCPQDEVIIKLNAQLNETYLWYGKDAAYYRSNQVQQDNNALALGESVAASRVATKAGRAYSNRGRDLVDSYKEDERVLEEAIDAELPEDMQRMSDAERKAHVEAMANKRAELQEQIRRLSAEREAYLAAERKRLAEAAGEQDATLGDAILTAIRVQLDESGFEVQERTEAE